MSLYMVVFTNEPEQEVSVHLAEPFWTIVLNAQNAKDARRKAWREVNQSRQLLFIKRDGWRIFDTGRLEEVRAAGVLRAAGIRLVQKR